jgi:hypothetical protein
MRKHGLSSYPAQARSSAEDPELRRTG